MNSKKKKKIKKKQIDESIHEKRKEDEKSVHVDNRYRNEAIQQSKPTD